MLSWLGHFGMAPSRLQLLVVGHCFYSWMPCPMPSTTLLVCFLIHRPLSHCISFPTTSTTTFADHSIFIILPTCPLTDIYFWSISLDRPHSSHPSNRPSFHCFVLPDITLSPLLLLLIYSYCYLITQLYLCPLLLRPITRLFPHHL